MVLPQEARIEGLRLKSKAFDVLCEISPTPAKQPAGRRKTSDDTIFFSDTTSPLKQVDTSFEDEHPIYPCKATGACGDTGTEWTPMRKWGRHRAPTIAELNEFLDKADRHYRRSRSCEPAYRESDLRAQLRKRDAEISRLKDEIETLKASTKELSESGTIIMSANMKNKDFPEAPLAVISEPQLDATSTSPRARPSPRRLPCRTDATRSPLSTRFESVKEAVSSGANFFACGPTYCGDTSVGSVCEPLEPDVEASNEVILESERQKRLEFVFTDTWTWFFGPK